MMRFVSFSLFVLVALGLSGCSGQGVFNFDVKVNTPTAGAPTAAATRPAPTAAPTVAPTRTTAPATATSAPATATSEEVPPPSGGKEITPDVLTVDVKAFIELTLRDEVRVGEPRIFLVQQNAAQVDTQFNQQLVGRGFVGESTSSGLVGKVKVMIFQKGKARVTVMIVNQGSAETVVFIQQSSKK